MLCQENSWGRSCWMLAMGTQTMWLWKCLVRNTAAAGEKGHFPFWWRKFCFDRLLRRGTGSCWTQDTFWYQQLSEAMLFVFFPPLGLLLCCRLCVIIQAGSTSYSATLTVAGPQQPDTPLKPLGYRWGSIFCSAFPRPAILISCSCKFAWRRGPSQGCGLSHPWKALKDLTSPWGCFPAAKVTDVVFWG